MSNKSALPVLLFAVFVLLLAVSCGSEQSPQQKDTDESLLTVAVSILPQQSFVEQIAGDLAHVVVMVPPGQSPSTYEPTTQQLQQLSRSSVFFTIGVPFEQSFIPLLEQNLPELRIVETDANTAKRRFLTSHSHDEDEHEDEEELGSVDPHSWMSPIAVIDQIDIMTDHLVSLDPEHESLYRENAAAFTKELTDLDRELASLLKPITGETLLVYHPAFGYFADRYGLIQKAIEVGGKEPTPRELEELVRQAKQEEVSLIFVQPEFDANSAQTIAEAIGAEVVTMGSLEQDYIENLRNLAQQLRRLKADR
jgi:zinc transport system substrate-binding protein